MHASTHRYLEIVQSDDAAHKGATVAVRAAVVQLQALNERASRKGAALVAVELDEAHPKVKAILYEGHDRQKTTQRLIAEWQERTLSLLKHMQDVEAYDARLLAATVPDPAPESPVAP